MFTHHILFLGCTGDKKTFKGLIMFVECHKAKIRVRVDEGGNAINVGKGNCTETASYVLELQKKILRARVV